MDVSDAIGIGFAAFTTAVVLDLVVTGIARRLKRRLLDPRRMSRAERDIYFNREYAPRVPNATALSSPPSPG